MTFKEQEDFIKRINAIKAKKKKELSTAEFNELISRFNGRNTTVQLDPNVGKQ